MNKPHEAIRGWAQLLYTSHNSTVQEISMATGAPEAAIRNWVQQGNWDGLRVCFTTTRHTQLTLLYDILYAHIVRMKAVTEGANGEGNSKDADLLLKYTAAIKNLEKETSVREIIDVAKLFIDWLMKYDLTLAKQVNRQFNDFITARLNSVFE